MARVTIVFEDVEGDEGTGVELLADFEPMPKRPVKSEDLTNAQVLGAHLILAAKKLMADVVAAGDAKWRTEIDLESSGEPDGGLSN